jgi:hypothetical protein
LQKSQESRVQSQASRDGTRFAPDLDAWDAWRPDELAARLTDIDVPWYVAGGWAIDLFPGEERRAHEDLEIGIPHDRFDSVAPALPEMDWFAVGDGLAWPLPACRDRFEDHHQTWGRDRATGRWRLDIMREPHDRENWIARRDARIRMPYSQLIQWTPDGIPYGAPEVVLLFKAKAARPKDEADFAAVLPRLTESSREWLRGALALVHPGHRWRTIVGNDQP